MRGAKSFIRDQLRALIHVKPFLTARTCAVSAFLICAAVIVSAQNTVPAQETPPISDAKFDAARLRTGRFDYHIMQNGKQLATFTITIAKQAGGNFRFTAKGLD